MRGAYVLDFEVVTGEVCLSIWVRNLTSGGIPIEIADWELGKVTI